MGEAVGGGSMGDSRGGSECGGGGRGDSEGGSRRGSRRDTHMHLSNADEVKLPPRRFISCHSLASPPNAAQQCTRVGQL